MSNQPRHEQLIAAGWIYDSAQDRYRKPGSATDGTATLYSIDAAWMHFQADQLDSATDATPAPPSTRRADPRKQEPE